MTKEQIPLLTEDLLHNGRLLARKGTPITEKMIPYLPKTTSSDAVSVKDELNAWFAESITILAHESRYGQALNGKSVLVWLQTCFLQAIKEKEVIDYFRMLKKEKEIFFYHTIDVFFLFVLLGKHRKAKIHTLYPAFIQHMVHKQALETIKNDQIKNMLLLTKEYSALTFLNHESTLHALNCLMNSLYVEFYEVAEFMNVLHRYPIGTKVYLSNGHIATILSYDHPLLPVVLDHTAYKRYRLPLNREIRIETLYTKKRHL